MTSALPLVLITSHWRESISEDFRNIFLAIAALAQRFPSAEFRRRLRVWAKPVLVMRDTTERPEAVTMGTVKLVGTEAEAIIENISKLLNDRPAYNAMARIANPYGDGKAFCRIIDICANSLLARDNFLYVS